MKSFPIIIIDDDSDDLDIIKDVFAIMNLTNKIHYFESSIEAFEFLKLHKEKILFILSDVNMPKMNGLQLRQEMNKVDNIRERAIPFLFFSTSGEGQIVKRAYSLNIQGFFKKPITIKEYQQLFESVIGYWDKSELP